MSKRLAAIIAMGYPLKTRRALYRLIGSVHTLTGLPGAIAQFLREMDSLRKAVATEAGLSAGELRAMSRIAEADGVTPKQIAVDLELTTGAITAITNGLVQRGLVVRVEHAHDRRSLLLQLTPEGHALMDAAYRHFQSALGSAVGQLGDKEQSSLVTGITHITANLKSGR